jgi:SAM-dependent methyltransferase
VFEALAAGPLMADEVAARCQAHPGATTKLLNVLVAMDYLKAEGARYALTSVARKWLLKDSPGSLRDAVLIRYVDWDWVARLEEFVQTGAPIDIHSGMSTEQWGVYQRGMRSIAGAAAGEMARRTPVPPGARDMLDIGGSHGYYSVLLCRRHPGLRAVVLDLPEAVAQAAPILAREGMGDRVVHRACNALTDDLGTDGYDLVLIAQVVHHFDDATNRALARRVARALRPGGYYVIQEITRPRYPGEGGGIGALFDLYFALTSEAGTFSYEEMADWQREAGLIPKKPIRFFSVPGAGEQVAVKPA